MQGQTVTDIGDLTDGTYTDPAGSLGALGARTYGFTLATQNDVRLDLTGLGADVDVALLAADGATVLGASAAGGLADEMLQRLLGPGDYFVHVYAPGGASDYVLTLSARADWAGNSTGAARDLDEIALGSAADYGDYIGGLDTNDYYQFSLAEAGTLEATLSGLNGSVELHLHEWIPEAIRRIRRKVRGKWRVIRRRIPAHPQLLDSAPGDAGSDAVLGAELAAGTTYYLQVTPVGGASTPYNLNVAAN